MKRLLVLTVIMLISLLCIIFTACNGNDELSNDESMTFADADNKTVFVLTYDGEEITGVINTLTFDTEADAKTVYDVYNTEEHMEMCTPSIDGNKLTLTYTQEYAVKFYGERTKDEVIQSFKDNGFDLQ